MKNKMPAYITIIISVLLNCIPATQLEVSIIEQPVGGKNVAGLSCIFEGYLTNNTSPITTSIEWWWADSAGATSTIRKTENHEFSSDASEQVTTTLTAPVDSVLIDSFWVRISWDEDGVTQQIESDHIYCYQGPNTE